MLIAGSCKLTQNLLIQKSVFGHLCLGIKGDGLRIHASIFVNNGSKQ